MNDARGGFSVAASASSGTLQPFMRRRPGVATRTERERWTARQSLLPLSPRRPGAAATRPPPPVERPRTEPMLPGQLVDPGARLRLLQQPDDPFLGKPRLPHRRLPFAADRRMVRLPADWNTGLRSLGLAHARRRPSLRLRLRSARCCGCVRGSTGATPNVKGNRRALGGPSRAEDGPVDRWVGRHGPTGHRRSGQCASRFAQASLDRSPRHRGRRRRSQAIPCGSTSDATRTDA